MDSSFVTFSPKRKLKKPVHNKITKLSLSHPKRGYAKKSSNLCKNKSPPRCERFQQTPPRTRISNLSGEGLRYDSGRKYLLTGDNNSSKGSKIDVINESLSTEKDDLCRRAVSSQLKCSVKVENMTRPDDDIESPAMLTPPSVLKSNTIIVISESSSDDSNSVPVRKPNKTSNESGNIVINESDSAPESFHESANPGEESTLSCKVASTVLSTNAASEKQLEIEKWLQNISPQFKNNHHGSREEHVPSSKSASNDSHKSWRSPANPLSSESEDNFEEFIKSVKKKNHHLLQKLGTPDSLRNFLTDGSADNSPAFYLSLTNTLRTEEKKKIVAERTKKIYEKPEKIRPIELKFCESDTEASDEEKKELVAVQKGGESTKVYRSPDVETVSSGIASEDSEDDSDSIPPTKQPTGKKTVRPYQKQSQKVPSCRNPKDIKEKSNTVSQFPVYSFLTSLSHKVPQQQCQPDAFLYRRDFKKRKEDLCSKLFCLYNSEVFKKQLPSDMSITWNARLMKTAGLCYNKYSASKRTSRIELSVKVCDSADRLRDTLIHELCHSASWIIDGAKSGHGRHWKRWADRAMKCFPDIPPIRRCHDYKIATKFTYKCVQCGYSIGRHTKSLDMERKRCGYCLGKFELFVNKFANTTNTKTPAQLQTPRTPSAFAVFVKENYGSVKKERSELKHGEVMKLLGQKFAVVKISSCLNTV